MATYETRQVKGWRSLMEAESAELRRRVWEAPAVTKYHEGLSAPLGGNLAGCVRWFHREFGDERAMASAELKQFRSERLRIARSEWTQEQKDAANAYLRNWRANQSDEWRAVQAAQKRARRAAKPELYQAIDQRYAERHRSERNARKRAAYARAPELARAKLNAQRAARRERNKTAAAQNVRAPV